MILTELKWSLLLKHTYFRVCAGATAKIGKNVTIRNSVGSLTRLNKNFVIPAITDFCNYARTKKDKKFLLLLIGDSNLDKEQIPRIGKIMQSVKDNVDYIITGYVFPVPTKLLELCDVFFASSGCADICRRSGIPTISYDGIDCKPIGVYGRTTYSNLFRTENEPPLLLSQLLDDVLIDKKYTKEQSSFVNSMPDYNDHIEFLRASEQKKEYFDVSTIRPESTFEKKYAFLVCALGRKQYEKMLNAWIKLQGLFNKKK